MPKLHTYRLGDGGWAVALHGDLDGDAVLTIVDEVAACTGGAVVVDLRHARFVDHDAVDLLVSNVQATFVAERPLRDALERRPVAVAPNLRMPLS